MSDEKTKHTYTFHCFTGAVHHATAGSILEARRWVSKIYKVSGTLVRIDGKRCDAFGVVL